MERSRDIDIQIFPVHEKAWIEEDVCHVVLVRENTGISQRQVRPEAEEQQFGIGDRSARPEKERRLAPDAVLEVARAHHERLPDRMDLHIELVFVANSAKIGIEQVALHILDPRK